MAGDFVLRRFCLNLVGAPNDTIIVTDPHPLQIAFNGKRNGSIRTEHTKLKHQDIRFLLQYKKGITNPANYLSRHGIHWQTLSKNEKNKIYTLYVTPILDTIKIKEIAKKNNNDSTLKDLRDIIQSGKPYIPNDKTTSYPV